MEKICIICAFFSINGKDFTKMGSYILADNEKSQAYADHFFNTNEALLPVKLSFPINISNSPASLA